jgi:acetoin utilization deacetylase AcuC-like enzyme
MDPIPVFYDPRQNASDVVSFSPSAAKPALVVEGWRRSGVPIRLLEPLACTVPELCRAHDPNFVRDVLTLRCDNGFGGRSPAVAASLPWTTGSHLSAARHALATGAPTFSPTSGFHHAGWDRAAAFCTFNGLMVTALALRAEASVERVAILDLDCHYGDGTVDIIRRLGIHWIQHHTFGEAPPTADTAGRWLAGLPQRVASTIQGCELVLFQAGADPHLDDPLGGILTSEQLAARDRIVFEVCRNERVPVVVNLAGGYQRPVSRVVELHVRTLQECWEVHSGAAAESTSLCEGRG